MGKPRAFQVTVLDWSQDPSGQDVTSHATAVLAAPSIVEIPPGLAGPCGWCALKASARRATTRAAAPVAPALHGGPGAVLIHQNLPVGFEDAKAGPPVLTARFTPNGVLLTNSGPPPRVTAVGPQGMPAWREGALGWVLRVRGKLVELKPDLKAASVTVTVNGTPSPSPQTKGNACGGEASWASRWPCPSAAHAAIPDGVEPVLAAPILANGQPAKDPVVLWQQNGAWVAEATTWQQLGVTLRPGEEGRT